MTFGVIVIQGYLNTDLSLKSLLFFLAAFSL